MYKGADVFAICVEANSIESDNAIERWVEEIRTKEPFKPICLILTKMDQLEDRIID